LVGDGNGYFGNIDLKPEQAHTVSATFDLHAADRRWEFRATPYYTRVTDYIDAIRCSAGASCTHRPTGRRAISSSFSSTPTSPPNSTVWTFPAACRSPRPVSATSALVGVLTYTHGENRDTGDDLYNIMPLNGKLALTHALGGWKGELEVVAAAAKDDLSDVRNEIRTAGYGLTNLRGSYTWKQVRAWTSASTTSSTGSTRCPSAAPTRWSGNDHGT
jgi:iron complex outermembrane receptor protein